MPTGDLDKVRAAQAKLHVQLKDNANVNGIGITSLDGAYALKVNLTRASEDVIPEEIDDVKVKTEVVGRAYALKL